MHRVIGERSLTETAISSDLARQFLTDMVLAREFDRRAVALQRRGWMSGYPPYEGQEASQVGAAHALGETDWLFPTYRSNAMQLARGRPPADILAFRQGRSEFEPDVEPEQRERSDGRTPGGTTFAQATPIATQLPHAVGAAMAADYRDADHAVCAYFGDGATSEGDFHEAMNFAGVFDAPVVFFCENNHWAISMAADRQTASDTLAQKAEAYGFGGVRVDGMDPLAVYEAVDEARSTALDGEPVMVESLTYRQGAHSTSDDPERYRDEVDLPDWRTGDPVERYASYLREEGVIDADDEATGERDGDGEDAADQTGFVAEARAAANEILDEAVATVEAAPEADPSEVFDYTFESIPPRLASQRQAMLSAADGDAARDES